MACRAHGENVRRDCVKSARLRAPSTTEELGSGLTPPLSTAASTAGCTPPQPDPPIEPRSSNSARPGAVGNCHDTVRIRRIQLLGGLAEIRCADGVVASEHARRLVSAQLHHDMFRHARPRERGDGRAAQIVRNAARASSQGARPSPAFHEALNRFGLLGPRRPFATSRTNTNGQMSPAF